MHRMHVWRNILLSCFSAAGIMAAEPPPIEIPRCAPPPVLDGALNDSAWQNAATIRQLYREQTDIPVNDTTIYLARDAKWLYLGFQCANSNMAHVVQTVFKHDDLYPKFYANESVEIYIKPDAEQDRYYWFVLSANNVAFEQRIQKTPVFKQETAWSAPWRSAARLLSDGWTAEVAIPLFALECKDLSGALINLVRNCRAVELDPYGAKQGEKTVLSTLRPNTMGRGKTHAFNNFAAVAGLGEFSPEPPFAPRIAAAEITGLRREGSNYFYDVQVTLALASPVTGKTEVRIVENAGAGDAVKASAVVELDGKLAPGHSGPYQLELVLSVPSRELNERQVTVALADPQDGSCLAAKAIMDLSALNIVQQAFVGRSYYTDEKHAAIRLELGLPESILKETVLTVDVNGAPALEIKGLDAVMTVELPLSALQLGDNALNIRLAQAGKELAARSLNVQRLAPRPGHEVKADFIKGIVLKDNQPIFPVGIYVNDWSTNFVFRAAGKQGDPEDLFKFLKELGFTTLVNGHMRRLHREHADPSAAGQADLFAKSADKYGLNVVEWVVPAGLSVLDPAKYPLSERLSAARKLYRQIEPALMENTRLLREHRNLLAYYNVDEPNLGGDHSHVKIAAAEWYYNTVQAIDPYRPRFLLYSMNIPHGGQWTRWGEILGFDIYPRPFMNRGIYSEPGLYTAYYAHALRERCRQDHKIMFFVPLSNMLDLGRTLVGMSKAHMLCQAYTAVIHGARGLLYFVLQAVVGEDAWDALQTINFHIREMAPALLNGDIARHITYSPGQFNPAEQKFPPINAAVYKYPNGDHLMLAVNIMPYAVDTEFKIGGLQTAARLFGADENAKFSHKGTKAQSEIDLRGKSFSDKIEGYGVRAYRLTLAGDSTPVRVALDMQEFKDEKAPDPEIQGIIRRVRRGKNHMPNPCFQHQFNRGVPDCFLPAFYGGLDPFGGQPGSSWFVDNATAWNGNPSLCMICTEDTTSPSRFMAGVYFPPATDRPRKLVFSFYAKGAKDGDMVKIGKHFPLTTQWRRYQFTGELPPGNAERRSKFYIVPAPLGARIWISGLQVELGETATEFQDDSAERAPKTFCVAPSGDDRRTGEGGWTNAMATISHAVKQARAGDTVLVSNGAYVVTSQIDINDAINVRAWPPADAPGGAVITTRYPDPACSTRCVKVNSSGAVLAGFTVENGYPGDSFVWPYTKSSAGGIWLQAGLVSNCVVRGCTANYGGGGIWAAPGTRITDCTIVSNRNLDGSYNGAGGGVYLDAGAELLRTRVAANYDAAPGAYNAGGVYAGGAGARIADCSIVDNTNAGSAGSGGGIHCFEGSAHLIDRCIISNNFAKINGGGIYLVRGVNNISASAITHNRAGIAGGGILAIGNALVAVSNCDITCNAAGYGAGLANNANTASRGHFNIQHSRIAGNISAGAGAGAYLMDNNGVFAYTVIISNVAGGNRPGAGAGLSIGTRGDTDNLTAITNCLIAANSAEGSASLGGGIYISNASVALVSSTVAGNQAARGGGLFVEPDAAVDKVQVWNTIVAANTAAAAGPDLGRPTAAACPARAWHYSCSPGLDNAIHGNITSPPVFADAIAADYRLAAGSAGIDAGTNQDWMINALDLAGAPRIDSGSGRVDMGVYECVKGP